MPRFPVEDATDLAQAVARRTRSSAELVDEALDRVAAFDPLVRALTAQMAESAREAARQADRQVAAGNPLPPLHGVPIVAKDLFDFQAGVPNTFGCVTLADFVPDETSAYLERLAAAGAIVIGRSNVPTLGHKGTTDNRLMGPTSTPFDLSRNAGGSSGGSAAAVATGMVPLAQGSDAGGSVRIPASCCGIVGLKPTFGRIPNTNRSDVFSSHTPFVQAGPLTRTVRDAALALQVMSGPHPRDPLTCCNDARDFVRECEQSVAGKRIAYTPDWGVFAIEPSVAATTQAAIEALAEAGAIVEQPALRLPLSQDELAALWRRELAPFYAGLLGYFAAIGRDLEREPNADLPDPVRELAELGRSLTALDLQADQRLRTLVYHSLQDALDAYDFVAMPTLSCLPPANDADGQTLGPPAVAGREVERTIGWCLTHPVNFTGHPAASVPAGLSREGLPVGLQVIGRRYEDGAVLSVCRALEERRPWLPYLAAACERLMPAEA